jgi:hypothetical protein
MSRNPPETRPETGLLLSVAGDINRNVPPGQPHFTIAGKTRALWRQHHSSGLPPATPPAMVPANKTFWGERA